MTRFRPVFLCFVTFLCAGLAAPALALPPFLDPSGIIETIHEVIGNMLAWFGG